MLRRIFMSRTRHPCPQQSHARRVHICQLREREGSVFGVGGKKKIQQSKVIVINFLEVALYVVLVMLPYVFPQKEIALRHFIQHNIFFRKVCRGPRIDHVTNFSENRLRIKG